MIGAGGSQAQAMLVGAAHDQDMTRWVAADRVWRSDASAAVDALGMRRETIDLFEDDAALDELVGSARLVANFAGPYYRTGGAVLESAIRAGTHYWTSATTPTPYSDCSATTRPPRTLE